jgi:hypothetical protein
MRVMDGRRRGPADTATLRPVNPQVRTRPGASGQLSAVCHEETHAPQQTALLLDHFIGTREQHRRHVEAERPGSL